MMRRELNLSNTRTNILMLVPTILAYLMGAALVGLVGLQVAHHVETGGTLFFQAPSGCVKRYNGTLDCSMNETTLAEPSQQHHEESPPAMLKEQQQEDRASEPERRAANERPAPRTNGDDGPAGAPRDVLKNGVAFDDDDNDGRRPPRGEKQPITAHDIHDAAHDGNIDLLQQLLSQRPDLLDVADHNRWNALHMAARAGFTDIVKLLLRLGADTRLRTLTSKTAYEIAKERLSADHPIIELLKGPVLVLPDGGLVTAHDFRMAADLGRADQVQHYIEIMMTTTTNDNRTATAIMNDADANRWNALHMAARSGHAQVVKLLVDAGANPTLRTASQKTALTIAIEKHGNDNEIVDILRSALADEL